MVIGLAVNIGLVSLTQHVELDLFHLPLLALEICLDHLKVGILNLVLCQVEIVTVLTIKPYRVTSLAVTKGVVRNALPSKNVGKRFRFF